MIGHKHTEETKRKISEAQLGEKNHMFGKKMSGEARRRMSESHKGKMMGIQNPRFGKHHTNEAKKTISLKNKGKKMEHNNPMWKGDEVGYGSLHEWVKNRLPKPASCEHCHAKEPYDLANRSGKYLRDLSDWEWLCRGCHMIKDGRIKKLRECRQLWINKNGHPMLGKHHSEETKRRMSETLKGKKISIG